MIQGFRYVWEYKIVIVYIYIYIVLYERYSNPKWKKKKKKKCYRETESTQPVKSSKTIFVRFVPESLAVYPQRIDRITAPIERRFHVTFVTRYRRFFSPGITTGYVRRRARWNHRYNARCGLKKRKRCLEFSIIGQSFLTTNTKWERLKKREKKKKETNEKYL